MNNNFKTIEPSQSNLSDLAVIERVMSEENRLSDSEHEKAAKAFLLSDSIASGIARDFAFVKKIPQYIKQIIDNKSWECLYVAKGVSNPYYCRYTKGTDSENFRAFITAKRPNGLETTIDEVDNLLNSDPEVQRQFRTLIYESPQEEKTDLTETTSHPQNRKLKSAKQKRIRAAAKRAAKAVPIISELLDRKLIAMQVAAKLGRNIKDPDNLTANEREYVDNRDLIGLRINEYINSNPIPEDEYKEPAYGRKLNRFVQDLLTIKKRSKSVRIDNPKKAANQLLHFYQGKKLQCLIDYLERGLESLGSSDSISQSSEESIDLNSNQNGNMPQSDSATQLDLNLETETKSTPPDENDRNSSDVADSTNSTTDSDALEETKNSDKRDIINQETNENDRNSSEVTDSTNSTTNSDVLEEAKNSDERDLINQETNENDRNYSEVTDSTNSTTDSDVLEDRKNSDERDLIKQETEVKTKLLDENNQSFSQVAETATSTDSKILEELDLATDLSDIDRMCLTSSELSERLGIQLKSLSNATHKQGKNFPEWSKQRDPEGISWQKSKEKRGRSCLFTPIRSENTHTD